jgi:ribosome maturation factor RimP
MLKADIEALVEKLVIDIIADTQLELVDVEYVKEHDWYLRVFLDKTGGIEVEDCQWVSERLEKKLDELDPVKDSYYLEVSSPGLERALTKDRDFIRHSGDQVKIQFYTAVNGEKSLVGTLVGLENDQILLEKNGEQMAIPRAKTAQIRLHLEL